MHPAKYFSGQLGTSQRRIFGSEGIPITSAPNELDDLLIRFYPLLLFRLLEEEEEEGRKNKREAKKLVNKEGSRISAACQAIRSLKECRRWLLTRWKGDCIGNAQARNGAVASRS